MRTFAPAFEQNGQSCTASSLGIPQGGNAAMQVAAHPPL